MEKVEYVERYKKPTRALHWVHTAAFVILFFTGLFLFIPGLGFLAQDSWSRIIHRVFAAIFIVGPIIYLFLRPRVALKGIKEAFTWGIEDMEWLMAAPRYYFLADERAMPPQGHMNTGQKLWWFMVIVLGVVLVLTGIIMVFFKTSAPLELLRWSVFIHDVAFIATGAMFFVHIYLSVMHPLMRPLRTGAWSSMSRGKVSTEYAAAHHGKWYEEITKGKGA